MMLLALFGKFRLGLVCLTVVFLVTTTKAQQTYKDGGITLHDKVEKEVEIEKEEYAAKMDELKEEYAARVADEAQMPTSTFPAMGAAANSFLDLVQQNLMTLTRAK